MFFFCFVFLLFLFRWLQSVANTARKANGNANCYWIACFDNKIVQVLQIDEGKFVWRRSPVLDCGSPIVTSERRAIVSWLGAGCATSHKLQAHAPCRLVVSRSSSISAAPCARLVIIFFFVFFFYQQLLLVQLLIQLENARVFTILSVIIEINGKRWRCSFQGNHKMRVSSSSSRRYNRNICNSRVNRLIFKVSVQNTRKVITTITTGPTM